MNHNDSCSGQRIENVINYLELTQNAPLYLPCTWYHHIGRQSPVDRFKHM